MQLEHHVLDVATARPFRIATDETTTLQVVVCSITHDGATGRGDASPSARVTGESVESVRAFLDRAADAFRDVAPERAFDELDRMHAGTDGHPSARCAVDVAVHDLLGKLSGKPVHRFYGLEPGRMETSATVSLDSPSAMAAEALDWWTRGFRCIKLKLGDAAKDEERVAAVRRVVPQARLRADANTGWSPEDAWDLLVNTLPRYRLDFVEQPFPPAQDAKFVELSQKSPIVLYADESALDARDVKRLADLGFRGGFNFKMMKSGGLRPTYRALQEARHRGYGTQLGCMLETGLSITAATHLLPLLDHADLDGNVLLARDPFRGARPVDGWLTTPTGAGVGAEPAAE